MLGQKKPHKLFTYKVLMKTSPTGVEPVTFGFGEGHNSFLKPFK